MATHKQIVANRENAIRSTGPKTPKGKAIVALNAIKHGILSKQVLLPDEEEPALVELGKRMRAQLQPVGEMEVVLADRIISSVWRLRRVLGAEVELMQQDRFDCYDKDKGLAGAFTRGREKLANLSRYEAAIERSLYKAYHELQRLQAERAGRAVPLPIVVEVDRQDDGQAE